MTCSWPYPGSRWWKFDFHTHTPASKDTSAWQAAIGSDDEVTPEKWLLRYMAAEIDCVAITDHNSGAWIDKLKDAYANMQQNSDGNVQPQGFRDLYLFPGVEISVASGLHILSIFDETKTSATISHLLGAIGFPEQLTGETNAQNEVACTRESLVKVIEEIHRVGGIVIPAHSDQPRGLLRVENGSSARYADEIKSILDAGLLAIETVHINAAKPSLFIDKKLGLTEVLGSDCHSFQGEAIPSSRYTWVKMAKPTLEGLRLALLDGNGVSIRRSDQDPFDPFKTPEHFITRIEIAKARYMGHGREPQILDFTPFCNALIGGRGTGKSTIVHALRLAYRREDEIKSLNDDAEPRKQWERFNKIVKGRDGDGALREETEILVELMRDGQRYRLCWSAQGQGTVVEDWVEGNWQTSPSQAITPERFPIRIFSQDQIAAMAGDNRQTLLKVIDEAADISPLKSALEEIERTYLAQCARLRELDGKLQGRDEFQRQHDDLVRKLTAFDQLDHADILKAHQRALRQQREIEASLEQMDGFPTKIKYLAEEMLLEDWPEGVFDPVTDAGILQWRGILETSLTNVCKTLNEAASQLADSTRAAQGDPRYTDWQASSDQAHRDYETLSTTLENQGVDDPQLFGRLVQQRQSIEAKLRELDQLAKDAKSLKESIVLQKQRLNTARQAISDRRQAFLGNQLQGNRWVRMAVVPFGFDARAIERNLRELLEVTDDRFETDILTLQDGEPTGGLAYEIAKSDNKATALDSIKARLIQPDNAFGGHFRNNLQRKLEKPEFADRIRCWFPEDDLRIEFSRKSDSTEFMPISQGSPGQRAAALLAFLLAFGNEPLVLDQPEDDLDNHLIYELIVRQIRENKLRRQLIVATHNPNIVVNGDAEMVHAFEFGRGQCYVKEQGALQEKSVREEVCHVMEGGREAFTRRWARLGREV